MPCCPARASTGHGASMALQHQMQLLRHCESFQHEPGSLRTVVDCTFRYSLNLPAAQNVPLCCIHAGGIEEGAITLQPCQQYVDTWLTVSEQEIADAVNSLLQHHSKLVEGAAGCGLAAFRQLAQAGELRGKQVAVVCCGGNIAVPVLQSVLQTGAVWP